jgi:hypothetical protein
MVHGHPYEEFQKKSPIYQFQFSSLQLETKTNKKLTKIIDTFARNVIKLQMLLNFGTLQY